MRIIFTDRAEKDFKKLNKTTQELIFKWQLKTEKLEDSRASGKPLTSSLTGLWRYRVGDYRLICLIKDDEMVILCLNIAPRSKAYTDKNIKKILKSKKEAELGRGMR